MTYTPFGNIDPMSQMLIIFVFTFAVVFGALNLAKIFSRAVNVLISFALALFAISYTPFVSLIWIYLPTMIWLFIIIFFLGFIFKVFGLRLHQIDFSDIVQLTFSMLLLFTVGWYVMRTYFPSELPIIGKQENLIFLIGLLFIVPFFIYVFKHHPAAEMYAEAEKKKAAAKQ